jgi:hypothetical protein
VAGLQGRDGDAGIHGAADRIAHDLARPGIQDGSQVDEAARDGHVGQVGDPELVRAIGNDILGQVGIDRPAWSLSVVTT